MPIPALCVQPADWTVREEEEQELLFKRAQKVVDAKCADREDGPHTGRRAASASSSVSKAEILFDYTGEAEQREEFAALESVITPQEERQ